MRAGENHSPDTGNRHFSTPRVYYALSSRVKRHGGKPMADTSGSFSTDLGRILRGLTTSSGRFMDNVLAGYRDQAIRERQAIKRKPPSSEIRETTDVVVTGFRDHLDDQRDAS